MTDDFDEHYIDFQNENGDFKESSTDNESSDEKKSIVYVIDYSNENSRTYGDQLKWTNNSTKALINLINKHCYNFEHEKKKTVWSVIAKELNEEVGINVNGQQCDTKYKLLKKRYNSCVGRNITSWVFFESVEELLKKMGREKNGFNTLGSNFFEMANRDIKDKNTEIIQWTPELTDILLGIIEKHYHAFSCAPKPKVWTQIASEISSHFKKGINVDGVHCSSKFDRLKLQYHKLGTKYKFYNKIHKILNGENVVSTSSTMLDNMESNFSFEKNDETQWSLPKHSDSGEIPDEERRHQDTMLRFDRLLDLLERFVDKR